MSKGRVVVGLSGGVDSSVAAYLLQQDGYEVIGLFMKNWHDESVTLHSECPWVEDSNDALLVAQKLGIPFQTIDLSEAYKTRIVDYMFAEYQKGRTPNPDVLCNREIKFDIFLDTALQLGADFVATGHYCQREVTTINGKTVYHLRAGKDKNKDQSYFLCQVSQQQLSRALFPIGHLEKAEVREIARAQNLITADKKDSQGLCFVGKISLPTFLQQKLASKTGNIIEIKADAPIFQTYASMTEAASSATEKLDAQSQAFAYKPEMGNIVGTHTGAHYFTVGQRKGLNVGGTPEPLFVLATDVEQNIIYTGQGKNHPGLYRKALQIMPDEIHWLREDKTLAPGETARYEVRIRYRQKLVPATLHRTEKGLYIVFDEKMQSITSGQFAAWYQDEELIGSGVIA